MNLKEVTLTNDQLLYEFVNQSNNTGFLTDDLISIIKADRENVWSESLTANEFLTRSGLLEDQQDLARSVVRFEYSAMAQQTVSEKTRNNPLLIKKYKNFIEFKAQNPAAPFGYNDTLFIKAGPIGSLNPKLRHAHLTQDLSVVYLLSGFNPTVIRIYGIFSHKDLGTGQPANTRRQHNIAKQFINQTFQEK